MRSAIRSLAVTRLKIRQIGNSQGVLLPKDLLGEANAQLGDEMIATVKSNGVIELKPAGPDADGLMTTARGIMAKRRKVLRALAK
jgi:putative addiction module antidote